MPPDLELDVRVRAGAFGLQAQVRVDRGPIALVGPNGAGKTTLLRTLAGALPTEGTVRVRGRTLSDGRASLPPESRRVGYLPQRGGLFGHLTVAGNVAYGVRGAAKSARAAERLAALGVSHLADRRPRRLSGGERQRVAIARALATRPELLLLDEPTAALDVTARPEIRALLRPHLHDPARCAVVVTHDLRDLLAWDPVLVLVEGGSATAQGRLAELGRPDHPFLAELLAPLGG